MLSETAIPTGPPADFTAYLPADLGDMGDVQRAIPRIAKDARLTRLIEQTLPQLPTRHDLFLGDARVMPTVRPASVHLVLTSPPYWTLKDYNSSPGQLGEVGDYDQFLAELDRVWQRCYEALVPGGRVVCVVGDVCLSRRKNGGRHTVVPLHSSIQEHCRVIRLAAN